MFVVGSFLCSTSVLKSIFAPSLSINLDHSLGSAVSAHEMQNLSPLGAHFHGARRFLDLFLGHFPLSGYNLAFPQPQSSCISVFRLFKNLHP
jgi:hypothetical protein